MAVNGICSDAAGSGLALSVKAYRLCHLSQRERPWHSGKVAGTAQRRLPGGNEPSQALPRQIPPFVTYGDIFPRSGGSLSSQGEPSCKVHY